MKFVWTRSDDNKPLFCTAETEKIDYRFVGGIDGPLSRSRCTALAPYMSWVEIGSQLCDKPRVESGSSTKTTSDRDFLEEVASYRRCGHAYSVAWKSNRGMAR